MTCYIVRCVKLFTRRACLKMSGVSPEAPVGVQCVQRLSAALCPRLQINRLRWYQASVLFITFLTYMTYHLTRKPISVVKSVLHRNCSELPPPSPNAPDDWCDWPPFNTTEANTLLGALDSAFLFSYAGAMFVSGMVAERVDLRYFLSLGMLVSAAFCYMFGVGYTYSVHNISYYLVAQAGAGIAQTTGWPGTVAIVGKWFGNTKKGLIFGIWNSHTSLGNILGTVLASKYVETDWALSFVYPALIMGVAAMCVFLFLPPEPRHVGVVLANAPRDRDRDTPSRQSKSDDEDEDVEAEAEVIVGDQAASLRPNRHSANNPPPSASEDATESTALLSRRSAGSSAVSLSRALAIPGVVEFSLSLFFAKLVSYTFLYWLPLYIKTSTHLTPSESADLSTTFDVGAIAGAIAAGVLADRTRSPAAVCVAFYVLCVPALLVYLWWGATSYILNVLLLLVAGALVNGPYALITTAVSAELGTHSCLAGNSQALATVTAIIDGTGSVGAAVGPMLAGVVSSSGDWSRVFYMLIACDVMALLLLLRITKSEIVNLRQEKRLRGGARAVRIE